MRLLPLGHPGLGGGAAGAQSEPLAAPRSSRRSTRICAAAACTTASSAPSSAQQHRRVGGMIANTLPQSLIDNPLLSQWVGFEEHGRVRIATGKVEIGQGILTALAQIAAEELDVAPQRLRLVSGADRCQPGRGFHVGQLFDRGRRRIDTPGLRRGALAVPRSRSPIKLGCPAGELSVEDGKFLRAGKDTGADYWSLACEVALDRRASGSDAGQAAVDLSHRRPQSAAARPAGKGRGRCVHPRHRAGERGACARAAAAVARCASRSRSTNRRAPSREGADRHPARGRLRCFHCGKRDRCHARRRTRPARSHAGTAASPRPTTSASRPGSWRSRRAIAPSKPGTRRPPRGPPRRSALSRARSSPTARSVRPARWHEFKDGALEVWSHTQGPAVLRDWIARALGLRRSQVTVFHRQGAGAYGHNTADDAAFDAAFIAMRMPGRTVRVQWSREDEFFAAPISTAMAIGLRAMLVRDSRPVDWTIEIWSPPHAQRPGMNGNCQLHRRRGAARCAGAQRAQRRSGRARRRRNAQRPCHLRPAAPPADPSSAAARAAADLLAARAWCLGQRVRDRVVHRRARGDRGRRSRDLSAVAALRSARPAGGRDGGGDERLVRAPRRCADGKAHGFGFARYKNIASFAAVVAEVEVDEEVRLDRGSGAAPMPAW